MAAADAGLATAEAGLGGGGQRWGLDGRPKSFMIDEVNITATVEDERGKVALNGLKEDQARRLFTAAGVSGAKLDQLTASLMNWEDGGNRAAGAKVIDYAADGVRERSGPVRTLGELAAIRGMTPEVLDRITPALTLFFGDEGMFDTSTASPLALKVMSATGGDDPESIVRAREAAGERTKLDAGPPINYVGRPLTVRIVASDDRGGVLRRASIVELTGQPRSPLWVRAID
jgi:general secretion pathway protein K